MPVPSPRPLALPHSRHIKQGRDFLRIKVQGRRTVNGCLIANWMTLGPGTVSRLAVITPKRIGPAVVRNRARRLLRESYRLHQNQFLTPVDLVLVARPSIAGKDFAQVERDLLAALRHARLLKLTP